MYYIMEEASEVMNSTISTLQNRTCVLIHEITTVSLSGFEMHACAIGERASASPDTQNLTSKKRELCPDCHTLNLQFGIDLGPPLHDDVQISA